MWLVIMLTGLNGPRVAPFSCWRVLWVNDKVGAVGLMAKNPFLFQYARGAGPIPWNVVNSRDMGGSSRVPNSPTGQVLEAGPG